ncbi:MAG: 4-hydroxybenzoyl-CoA reductase subunit beta [Caldimonas sp.]
MDRLPEFRLLRPVDLAAAVQLIAEPGARVLAGGTDLLPNLRRGLERPTTLVDLGAVAGFSEIAFDGDGLAIGAGVTLARLAADPRIAGPYRAIAEAAREVAGPQHRHAATVGGNLCLDTRCVFYNQSEWWRAANGFCLKRGGLTCHVAPQGRHCHAAFCGDLAPVLIVLDAEVERVSIGARRRTPLADLYRDDGAAPLTLEPGELIAGVHLPRAAPSLRSGYRKARIRGAMDFPLAGVAMALQMQGPHIVALKVALTGTNAHPLRLEGIEPFLGATVDAALLGALGKLVARQASPMRTTAVPSNYRRQVASVLAQRLLQALAGREPMAERPCA